MYTKQINRMGLRVVLPILLISLVSSAFAEKPEPPTVAALPTTISSQVPTLSGQALAGSSVDLIVDGEIEGSGFADTAGNWEVTVDTLLSIGSHTFSATATNDAGEVSEPATERTAIVTGGAPLDFNGDGVTDITTVETSGNNTTFSAAISGSAKKIIVPKGEVAVADYDGDGSWDGATFKISGNDILWSIRESSSGNVTRKRFGGSNDTVLTGCRLLSAKKYSLAYRKGERIIATELGTKSVLRVSLSLLEGGDLLGCGDVTGDGIDELFFRTRKSNGQNVFAAIGCHGDYANLKSIDKPDSIQVLGRGNEELPLVAFIKSTSASRQELDIETATGSYKFPKLLFQSGTLFSSGVFVRGQTPVRTLLWQEPGSKLITSVDIPEPTQSKNDIDKEIAETAKTGAVLVPPQRVVKLRT